MWIYFIEIEKNNTKVVIPSDWLLLDTTRETQKELERFNIRYTLTYTSIENLEYAKQAWRRSGYEVVSIDFLAKAVVGWYCEIEEKPKAQPLPRYEDIFNKRKRRKKHKEENGSPSKHPKPLPHQRWVWNKKDFAEGTVEMIIEEVLRQGLFVEFLVSRFGQELMRYYGEALRDLVRKKIKELFL
jgi:hypothetical protein